MNIRFRRLHGPSLWADHPAVVAEFDHPPIATLPAETIASRWLQLDDKPLWADSAPKANLALADLVALIAVQLQHPDEPEMARVAILQREQEQGAGVILGCFDFRASTQVLRAATDLSLAIFRAQEAPLLAKKLAYFRELLAAWLPQNPLSRTLLREARALNIPVYPVAVNSRVWLFGQGARGVLFHQAATDRDAFIGARLSMDKAWSNELVISLGYPGTTHGVAKSVAEATRIATALGYPVVVKPVRGGRGKGVSAYVLDAQELGDAYAAAASESSLGVLVERYVAGHDHRLAVFGQRLAWVLSRRPAQVIGDGRRTVAELITAENERRALDPQSRREGLYAIKVDREVIAHLSKQGFSLQSCPPQGVSVVLNSVANVARGGTLVDLTDQVHPDNRDMAESIARAFRLDSAGIDFQTPDISRSWREVPCAVIEVNCTPGIVHDERARQILRARFPGDSDGRIPSLLLISSPAGLRSLLSTAIAEMGVCVGDTDDRDTAMGGMPRYGEYQDLPTRLMAMIADPACEVVVLETTAQAIAEVGLPLDRFSVVISCVELHPELSRLLQSCCSQLIALDSASSAQQIFGDLRDTALLDQLAAQARRR